MANVQYVSNNVDDFEGGGLYPGGTGVIKELFYTLWDYDGKQAPDSALAVKMVFSPTDGSNEGKDVEQYWSAGSPVDFAPNPDGGRLIKQKAREKQSDNSNWAFALKKFKENCGLEGAKLDGDTGIRILQGSVVTFVRMDQPKRDIPGQEERKDSSGKARVAQTLVPTKAKFPWQKGGTSRPAAPQASAAASTSTASVPATNGDTSAEIDVSTVIKDLLTKNGGEISYTELPKEMLGVLGSIDRTTRTAIMSKVKDPEYIMALAGENGWTFDGKILVL